MQAVKSFCDWFIYVWKGGFVAVTSILKIRNIIIALYSLTSSHHSRPPWDYFPARWNLLFLTLEIRFVENIYANDLYNDRRKKKCKTYEILYYTVLCFWGNWKGKLGLYATEHTNDNYISCDILSVCKWRKGVKVWTPDLIIMKEYTKKVNNTHP